ncbi:thiol-disulfide oxidoreductase ResA [bacterium BMS3Bbin08]|nr:thiol-disulfide oxidoreductase ResA [bacterium BMS3Bbin08]
MKSTSRVILHAVILLSIVFLPLAADAGQYSPWAIEKLVGSQAPEFTANDLSGKRVALKKFKGKPILLNFWATWCPYCREERPKLIKLYKEYRSQGLVIVAVSTDRSAQKVKDYLKKVPMDFEMLHDNTKEAAAAYGVYSLPTSFLIDREGIIKYKFMGLRDWTSSGSKTLIDKLLEK